MKPSVTIREGIEPDKEQLTQVSREAHASLRKVYRPRPDAKQIGTDVPYTRIVGIKDGIVVGMATYEVEGDALYFGSLGVLETFRCQGIARSLVEHIENVARETGFFKISCATIEETGNVPIFEKLGFTVISREKADKFESVSGAPIHEVKMEKILK